MSARMRMPAGVLWLVTVASCAQTEAAPTASPSPRQTVPEFFNTSLPTVPGWQVAATKGFYCRFFQYAGTGDYSDRFSSTLDEIEKEGKKQAANAFLNAHVSSESHEIQGSKWQASFVHICGDFAVIM